MNYIRSMIWGGSEADQSPERKLPEGEVLLGDVFESDEIEELAVFNIEQVVVFSKQEGVETDRKCE